MENSNTPTEALPIQENSSFRYFPFFDNKQPVFVLVLVGLIFYCTSLYNEYALDDGIIIHQNDYVLKGARGIKDILTKDVYASFYERMNAQDQLQGGRYRPLSVVSFALEQELIGTYRTGNYMQVEDLNKNGVLDDGKVEYNKEAKETITETAAPNKNKHVTTRNNHSRQNYEYNNYVDVNKDGVAQAEECYTCWDLDRNFKNDPKEDLNADGIFNVVDCMVYGALLRHFNNIWMYVLACVCLYLLFRNYLLRNNQDLAFLAALIFMTHPMHTEVVANVKSRDDIFSLLFISLTFLFAFKFVETKKWSSLIACAIMFFLALLSKEYALILFVLMPVTFYVFSETNIDWKGLLLPLGGFLTLALLMTWIAVSKVYGDVPQLLFYGIGIVLFVILSLTFFKRYVLQKQINGVMVVLYFTGLLYLALRYNSVNMLPGVPDTEILNNPFLLASGQEAFATKVFVLLKYLSLAFFPHPLISDYSFDTYPYRHFSDWDFILSLVLHLALLVFGTRLVFKKHVLGFAIATYLLFLIPVCNLFFPIGAVLGERLLFHSTIGFALALAWLALSGFDNIKTMNFNTKRTVFISCVFVLMALYGCKTWERNWDWKNDVTLFLKDVKNAPNSVLVLGNAGARWIDLADTKEITGKPLPNEDLNRFNDYNGQLHISDEDVKAGGYKDKREAALYRGIGYLKHAVELHPRYVNGFLNLGLAHFKLDKEMDAIYYWKRAEHLYPDNPYLSLYYKVYSGILLDRGTAQLERLQTDSAITEFKKWTVVQPKNGAAWFALSNAYFTAKKDKRAEVSLDKAMALDPGNSNYLEFKNEMLAGDSTLKR